MTYDQYIQWKQYVATRIDEELQSRSFEAGNNSSAFYEFIGVDVFPQVTQDEAPRAETWLYTIYGTIQIVGEGAPSDPVLAALVTRPSGQVANDSLFVQATQVIDIPEVSSVSKRITYYVTTLEPIDIQNGRFDRGIYRGGLKLNCEFYEEGNIFVRNYTLFVRQNGDSVTLTAPEPLKAYYLKILSAERL